ncbi:hypothetical protein CRE_17461 [Caenorhabditis remanei]|uniref:Glycoprotein n=1 Tax=Caenorhabditis remanei TaxID=31234 RepID=E3N257_CAERE|nr:hypothetical protein CRE_17461 [Caenorhabditis remanei]
MRIISAVLILLTLYKDASSKSIICTDNSPVQYFRIPKLHKCNYHRILNSRSEPVQYEVFKPNVIEYISEAKLCKKLVSEVSMYTDFSGYEHMVEKELNNNPITLAECREMINSKKCGYGTLSQGKSNSWSTNNKIEVDYPNRFTSFFTPKRYYKENCIVIETKVYSHFNQTKPTNVLADMNNCKYQDGFCEIKNNEIITWDVNKDQKCQYISIGILDGMYNNNLWVNNENQIALNFQTNKTIKDCNSDLTISDEGFAVKKINRSQYAPRQIPVAIPTYPQRQQQEDDRRRREQEETRKREQEDARRREQEDRRREELRNQEDARRREHERQKHNEDFEKKKQEKLKKEEELEKKKQEKLKKLQEEAEMKELMKQRQGEDWTIHDKSLKNGSNKANRTKREIADSAFFQPLPLPEYNEYLKIKQDCENLPNYEAFRNSREGCDSLTTYTDFINKIANFEKEQHMNKETWQPLPFPGYEEYLNIKEDCAILPTYDEYKTIRESCDAFPSYTEFIKRIANYELFETGKQRRKRELYSDFQAAGEFQYLENQSNNLLRHTTEVMCDIFNEQNEVLESLIRENPRRYIQKQLNHSAVKVRFIDSAQVVQVTFCKEIDEEDIDFIDITHFDGYKLSMALALGQIPIKIKSLGDKIWYFKNDYSGGIISSKPQLHPMIDYRTNITNMKDFKEFDLKFLDDKVVFHEHILLDMKTNIEEELLDEIREKADVAIDIHASNQDSTMPHEILDDVEGFFGKWWLRIWRVGVTIAVAFVYIFIARTFWLILSPKTFIDKKNKRERNKQYEGLELRELVRRPTVASLTVD